jgi:hypothetical protein
LIQEIKLLHRHIEKGEDTVRKQKHEALNEKGIQGCNQSYLA